MNNQNLSSTSGTCDILYDCSEITSSKNDLCPYYLCACSGSEIQHNNKFNLAPALSNVNENKLVSLLIEKFLFSDHTVKIVN